VFYDDVRKVRNHVTLRSRIVPKILLFAKTFQKGRGTQNVPNGTKNELEVNTFDFTEGWFRNSGLYELNAENQMIFIMMRFSEALRVKHRDRNEDTYAPMDLFDWLDLIAKLQDDGTTQEKIGERIGWSREKIKNHVTLRSKIGTQILIFAKSFQEGRVPEFGTNVPKNERGVTLRSQIGTEILVFAKNFQEGRVPDFGTAVPKNERDVTLRSRIGAEILILVKSFQMGRAPDFGAAAPKNERDVKKAETPPKVKRTRRCGSFFMRDSALSLMIMFLIATDLAGNTNTNSNKYIRLLTTAKWYGIIE